MTQRAETAGWDGSRPDKAPRPPKVPKTSLKKTVARAMAERAIEETAVGADCPFPPPTLPKGTRKGPMDGHYGSPIPLDDALPPGKRARSPLLPGRPNQPGQGIAAESARTDRARRILALSRLGWSVAAMADAEGCGVATVHGIMRERLVATSAALARETADVRERMLAGLEQQERTLSLISAGIASDGRAVPTYAEIIAANRALAAVRGQLATMQGIRPAGDDTYADWLAAVADADRQDGGADVVVASAWEARQTRPVAKPPSQLAADGAAANLGTRPEEKHDQPRGVHR